jgi:hypothetical protein
MLGLPRSSKRHPRLGGEGARLAQVCLLLEQTAEGPLRIAIVEGGNLRSRKILGLPPAPPAAKPRLFDR